jgi:hypothetical protein
MRKKYCSNFFILFLVAISVTANAQAEHITIEHDHGKCNHEHDKPTALSLKIDIYKTIIAGKWKSLNGSNYHFLPQQKLVIGKRPTSDGRWELMGQEGNVILRLWTTNEQGVLFPRFYNISDISEVQFTISRMFGGNDTLQFKKLRKSNKK